jgi:hypothetical protein
MIYKAFRLRRRCQPVHGDCGHPGGPGPGVHHRHDTASNGHRQIRQSPGVIKVVL